MNKYYLINLPQFGHLTCKDYITNTQAGSVFNYLWADPVELVNPYKKEHLLRKEITFFFAPFSVEEIEFEQ